MKSYSYKGKIIMASSKKEAITKIIAIRTDTKFKRLTEKDIPKENGTGEINMSIVNKWAKKNMDITDDKLGEDHWKNPKNGEVYYSWKAAMRLAKKVPGFHLPTTQEWNQLAEACGGICVNPKEKPSLKDYKKCGKLKQMLRIKPTGYYHGSFCGVGSYSYFWTATEYDSSGAYYRYLATGASVSSGNNLKYRGFSVRLVADS